MTRRHLKLQTVMAITWKTSRYEMHFMFTEISGSLQLSDSEFVLKIREQLLFHNLRMKVFKILLKRL